MSYEYFLCIYRRLGQTATSPFGSSLVFGTQPAVSFGGFGQTQQQQQTPASGTASNFTFGGASTTTSAFGAPGVAASTAPAFGTYIVFALVSYTDYLMLILKRVIGSCSRHLTHLSNLTFLTDFLPCADRFVATGSTTAAPTFTFGQTLQQQAAPTQPNFSFGSVAQPVSQASSTFSFGQPATSGVQTTAFGQPTGQTMSAFGQSPAFGQTQVSAAPTGASAFGQTTGTSAFSFGSNTTATSAPQTTPLNFGQPASTAPTPSGFSFGQSPATPAVSAAPTGLSFGAYCSCS